MATQPNENRPTIVLVHGAWADATGFDAEIRALQREGFRAIGFANPLRDLARDSNYLAEFLRTLTGPMTSSGSLRAALVKTRTSGRASSALLRLGRALRESMLGPPTDGVGAAGL